MAASTQTQIVPNVVNHTDDVDKLLNALVEINTKPLWAQMQRLNPPLPNPKTVPHIWKYDSIRPHLLRAGELVTEKQAERRVLMLVNPARGKSSQKSTQASVRC